MHILVVGGGREHAVAWKLAQSPRAAKVYMAPGNGGTATEDQCKNVAIAANDISGLLDFAQENSIALTVVGPQVPLAASIVDVFAGCRISLFWPHSGHCTIGSFTRVKSHCSNEYWQVTRLMTTPQLESASSVFY